MSACADFGVELGFFGGPPFAKGSVGLGWMLETQMYRIFMATILMATTLVSSAQAQPPRLEAPRLEAPRLEVRATDEPTLHAPVTFVITSATALAGLAFGTAILSISHCPDDDPSMCGSLQNQQRGVFSALLATSGVFLTSLLWLLTRSHNRAKARRGLQAFGPRGMAF